MVETGEEIRELTYAGPLRIADWHFRLVPHEEVVACCLWEYARESRSIGLAAAMHRLSPRQLPVVPSNESAGSAEEAKARARKVRAQARSVGFNYNAFLTRFWACDVGFLEFYDSLRQYGGAGAGAWQEFPLRVRRQLVVQLTEATVWNPLAPASVGELEQLWQANSGELNEVRIKPAYDDSEMMALFLPTEPLPVLLEKKQRTSRQITAAFTVDFSRFSDAEIERAFRTWLKTHRPKRWRQPEATFPTSVRRGRKLSDYHVALERLGLMRLLHWNTPRQIRDHLPEAWALYGRKEHDFRRELREAEKFFHERFPFLPKKERPESIERHMSWLRPFSQHAD